MFACRASRCESEVAHDLLCPRPVRNSFRAIGAVVAAMVLLQGDARAQTDSRLAVGLSVIRGLPASSSANGRTNVEFELRFGHEQQGWRPQFSFFNWFDTNLQQPIGMRTMGVGQLRLRPIVAGYGYTWIRGRASITGDVVGGYSLNSFELDSAAITEYAMRLGATRIASEATNGFAIKPEIQVWYDINPRFGLKVSGGYLVERPSVVITSSLGQDVRPIRADTFLITIGVVYSLF